MAALIERSGADIQNATAKDVSGVSLRPVYGACLRRFLSLQCRTMLETFFYLMIGHAFADFAFQPDSIAKGKNRFTFRRPPDYDEEAHGPFDKRLWVMAMTAHALIHAGFVNVITGEPILGLWQFLSHWFIDFERTSKRLTPWEDQTLHVLVLATTAVLVSIP